MLSIRQKAKKSAQRAALVSLGALMLFVGVGFLTLAAWFFLSVSFSPLESAMILAGAYVGGGLIVLAVGTRSGDPAKEDFAPEQPPKQSEAPPLVQAFVYGMQAGAKAASPKH